MAKTTASKGREILKSKEKFPEFNPLDYEASLITNLNFYSSSIDDLKKKKSWALAYWSETGKDVKNFSKVPDSYFSTVGAVAHLIHHRQIDLDIKHVTYLDKKYNEFVKMISKKLETDDVDDTVDAPPKEELELLEFQKHMAEFDHGVDMFFGGESFDAKAYLVSNTVKGTVSKKIADSVKAKYLKEAKEAALGKDPQLVEAYSHLGKRSMTKFITYLQGLIDSCEVASAITKAARKPRARKVKSPTELTKHLKWCAEDSASGLKSEHPSKIVNATEVWLYNVKNRRLFKYVALGGMTLSVKGMSVINVDVEKSGGKIIRKPEVQLKGAQNMTSRPLNALYKGIRSTESRAAGRISEEVVIVKCFG